MNTKDYWKIFNTDKSVVVLTDVPKNYRNGDGVYHLMKCLQKVYGNDLCSFQKFDERFDKIEDFNKILRTGYNFDGNRLLSAHLFEYDEEKSIIRVDRDKGRKLCENHNGYVYQIRKTKISAQYGWDGFRSHILWTMGEDSCYRHWGDTQFGKQNIVPTENIFPH